MIQTHTWERNLWAKETNKRTVQAFFHNRLETWIIHSQSSSLYNKRKICLDSTENREMFVLVILSWKRVPILFFIFACVSFITDWVCLCSCLTSICDVISSSVMYLRTKLTTDQTPSAAEIKLRKKPSTGPWVGIVQSNSSFQGREWLLIV